jgi:hypothetical protein
VNTSGEADRSVRPRHGSVESEGWSVDKIGWLSYIQLDRSDTRKGRKMSEKRDDKTTGPDDQTFAEQPIDLNVLFAEDGRDLNRLFPDTHFKRLLRDVKRNQRGVDRFLKGLENEDDIVRKSGGADEVS